PTPFPYSTLFRSEHGVLAVLDLVPKEVVADQLLLVVDVLLGTVRNDHVVDALKRVPGHLGPLTYDAQVVFERSLPRQVEVARLVLEAGYHSNHAAAVARSHLACLRLALAHSRTSELLKWSERRCERTIASRSEEHTSELQSREK